MSGPECGKTNVAETPSTLRPTMALAQEVADKSVELLTFAYHKVVCLTGEPTQRDAAGPAPDSIVDGLYGGLWETLHRISKNMEETSRLLDRL